MIKTGKEVVSMYATFDTSHAYYARYNRTRIVWAIVREWYPVYCRFAGMAYEATKHFM